MQRRSTRAGAAAGLTFNNNQPVNVNAGQNEATLAVNVPATTCRRARTTSCCSGQTPGALQQGPDGEAEAEHAGRAALAPRDVDGAAEVAGDAVSWQRATPTIKVGDETEVVVQVARQFNFDGEFKVELVLPPGAQGVEAPT